MRPRLNAIHGPSFKVDRFKNSCIMYIMKLRKDCQLLIKIVKDNFFATKKWFVEVDGSKIHTVGYTTKKSAEQACDAVVPDWRRIPKWPTAKDGTVIDGA